MTSHGLKHFIYARLADLIALGHLVIVFIAAFGWWLLPHHPLHFIVLLLTLASWIFTGSCILSQLELWLRKKYLTVIPNYKYGYLHYHLRHLTGYAPSLRFIRIWGLIYLISACILWIISIYSVTTVII